MNRIAISFDGRFTWFLDGKVVGPTLSFGTLTETLACAHAITNASETLIELRQRLLCLRASGARLAAPHPST